MILILITQESGVRSQESGVNPPLAPPRRGRKKKKEKVFWLRSAEQSSMALCSGYDIIPLFTNADKPNRHNQNPVGAPFGSFALANGHSPPTVVY
ncbi:hypothetical protein [Okeania sp. SIO2B3]|uniref:hypothetical protein n=1 Tax=Okeania sp. SIO2B3 TaxID=2607784 RepID=UPI0013BEC117|nr:hypothetical protein [Okeania sp. SIO2B3]NET42829.1 hypothetical protein [Okeania sp. SIO2B3]